MAIEAYIPNEVTFQGTPLGEAMVVTLYDADGERPHGSLTTPNPLPAGQCGGPLVVVGRRDSKLWRVTVPHIEVRNKSALGFEYTVRGPIERIELGPAEDARAKKKETRLEDLGATF